MDAAGEGRVLAGSNFRLVALFVICIVTILLHDFFHGAFDKNTKSIGIGCFHLRTGGGK